MILYFGKEDIEMRKLICILLILVLSTISMYSLASELSEPIKAADAEISARVSAVQTQANGLRTDLSAEMKVR